MSQDDILHYEQLWVKAEDLSKEIYKSISNTEMFDKIRNIMTGINEIDNSTILPQVKSDMKRLFVGEILFLLTAISAKENIDVYGALKDQLITNIMMQVQK